MLVLVAGAIVWLNWRRWRPYVCGLLATLILVPGAMGFTSVVLYLISDHDSFKWWLNSDGTRAYAAGTGIALLLWLLLGSAAREVASVKTANLAEFARLTAILEAVGARYRYAWSQAQGVTQRLAARAQAKLHLDAVRDLFEKDAASPRWTTGAGYVDVVTRLHRAEEALIYFDSIGNVLAGARYDDSRIDGSKIAQSRQLLERLAAAEKRLEADPWDPLARADLAQVRTTINDFRDSRRAGLVRQKTGLTATAILMAINAYALLGVAMIAGATRGQILAAAVFYLVGATVGLFSQLQAASTTVSVGEDYGLSRARLYQTPLFCGLGAIGGVVLTAMLLAVTPGPVNTTATSPTTTATTTATTTTTPAAAPPPSGRGKTATTPRAAAPQPPSTQPQAPPRLSQIFDLRRYPLDVLIAAIFGLTPSLLIARLHAAAERYKADLKSTEAAERPPES